ncbi:MAG: OmpA family protein, partial [Geminicoccaceae bacterium]
PGQSEFSCQGYPDGVSCISARNVYELTNSRSRVTQQDLEGIAASQGQGPAFDQVLDPLPSQNAQLELAPPLGANQAAAEPADGVMRVWVGPHATTGGDVTAPNYVYSRVDGGSSGSSQSDHTRRFEPLKGVADPTPTLDARPLEGGDITVTEVAEPATSPEAAGQEGDSPSRHVQLAEIYFESGNATVSSSGKQRLKNASARAAELKPRSLVVAGFTDRVGSKEANLQLAERRVDAVVAILKEAGVTMEIIAAAQGELKALSSDPDGTADPNSRKVWVIATDVAQPIQASAKADQADQAGPKALNPSVEGGAADGVNDATQAEAEKATPKPKQVAAARNRRGCRLCRGSDDHGDGGKDHDPGMDH